MTVIWTALPFHLKHLQMRKEMKGEDRKRNDKNMCFKKSKTNSTVRFCELTFAASDTVSSLDLRRGHPWKEHCAKGVWAKGLWQHLDSSDDMSCQSWAWAESHSMSQDVSGAGDGGLYFMCLRLNRSWWSRTLSTQAWSCSNRYTVAALSVDVMGRAVHEWTCYSKWHFAFMGP